MSNKKNIHEGHRSRMVSRLIRDGGEGFETHEILEMLLYNSSKRCNTNPVAHKLLEEFGTLTAVLTASPEELKKVNGIGDAAASLILTVGEVFRRALKESVTKGEKLSKSEDVKNFCSSIFLAEKSEHVRMIFLDNKYNFVAQEIICRGSIEQVKPDMMEMFQKTVRMHCPIVMLTHNHPTGSEIPSNEDKKLTRSVFNLLYNADIYLADHIIVGKYGTLSMRENNLLPDLWSQIAKDRMEQEQKEREAMEQLSGCTFGWYADENDEDDDEDDIE